MQNVSQMRLIQRASLLAELQKYQQVVEIPTKASKIADKTDRCVCRYCFVDACCSFVEYAGV